MTFETHIINCVRRRLGPLAGVDERLARTIERAHEHIAGYAVFNDFSARDIQEREIGGRLGPAKGKDFDTGTAIGPWLVIADEIANPYNLTATARINGQEWSRGNTGDTSVLRHRVV